MWSEVSVQVCTPPPPAARTGHLKQTTTEDRRKQEKGQNEGSIASRCCKCSSGFLGNSFIPGVIKTAPVQRIRRVLRTHSRISARSQDERGSRTLSRASQSLSPTSPERRRQQVRPPCNRHHSLSSRTRYFSEPTFQFVRQRTDLERKLQHYHQQ